MPLNSLRLSAVIEFHWQNPSCHRRFIWESRFRFLLIRNRTSRQFSFPKGVRNRLLSIASVLVSNSQVESEGRSAIKFSRIAVLALFLFWLGTRFVLGAQVKRPFPFLTTVHRHLESSPLARLASNAITTPLCCDLISRKSTFKSLMKRVKNKNHYELFKSATDS